MVWVGRGTMAWMALGGWGTIVKRTLLICARRCRECSISSLAPVCLSPFLCAISSHTPALFFFWEVCVCFFVWGWSRSCVRACVLLRLGLGVCLPPMAMHSTACVRLLPRFGTRWGVVGRRPRDPRQATRSPLSRTGLRGCGCRGVVSCLGWCPAADAFFICVRASAWGLGGYVAVRRVLKAPGRRGSVPLLLSSSLRLRWHGVAFTSHLGARRVVADGRATGQAGVAALVCGVPHERLRLVPHPRRFFSAPRSLCVALCLGVPLCLCASFPVALSCVSIHTSFSCVVHPREWNV
jgi:hypothetical protein